MISFGIKDALDVLLVAFFTYQIYKLMKSSGTLPVFSGIVSVVIVWLIVSQVLEMRLMGAILDRFISVGFKTTSAASLSPLGRTPVGAS